EHAVRSGGGVGEDPLPPFQPQARADLWGEGGAAETAHDATLGRRWPAPWCGPGRDAPVGRTRGAGGLPAPSCGRLRPAPTAVPRRAWRPVSRAPAPAGRGAAEARPPPGP